MKHIGWMRIVGCGLGAGFVWTVLSVLLLTFLAGDFLEAVQSGRSKQGGGIQILLLALNFAAGIWAVWFYAAIRPRYGPGVKTAVIAGLSWWVMASMQSAKWVALLAVPIDVVVTPLSVTLPATIVSTIVGGWIVEKDGFAHTSASPP